MQTSDTQDKIAPAMLKAQSEMGGVAKTSNNPFFKSKYADLGSVIEVVKPILNAHGLFFIQGGGVGSDGATVSVETRIVHESGQWYSSTLITNLTKHDAQSVGSAVTYLKRYGLQAMCGVPSEDDDGNNATQAAVKPKVMPPNESAKSLTATQWDKLDKEEQEFLQEIANNVISEFQTAGIESAAKALEKENLDNEEMFAIWSRFDSKLRSSIKAYQLKKREEENALSTLNMKKEN